MPLDAYIIRVACLCLAGLSLAAGGCGPSRANTQLRKENQQLQAQIAQLQRQREGDLARIRGLETGPGTRPVLPQSDLDQLYTAHGLSLGTLTGGYRDDPKSAVDDGVAVYAVPTDQDGQTLKAAGSFVVSVYDLATPEKSLVVSKRFSLEEAKKLWYGRALLFNYVLKVPFEKSPAHRELTVHVEFADALTGRVISADRKVTVAIPEQAAQ